MACSNSALFSSDNRSSSLMAESCRIASMNLGCGALLLMGMPSFFAAAWMLCSESIVHRLPAGLQPCQHGGGSSPLDGSCAGSKCRLCRSPAIHFLICFCYKLMQNQQQVRKLDYVDRPAQCHSGTHLHRPFRNAWQHGRPRHHEGYG